MFLSSCFCTNRSSVNARKPNDDDCDFKRFRGQFDWFYLRSLAAGYTQKRKCKKCLCCRVPPPTPKYHSIHKNHRNAQPPRISSWRILRRLPLPLLGRCLVKLFWRGVRRSLNSALCPLRWDLWREYEKFEEGHLLVPHLRYWKVQQALRLPWFCFRLGLIQLLMFFFLSISSRRLAKR